MRVAAADSLPCFRIEICVVFVYCFDFGSIFRIYIVFAYTLAVHLKSLEFLSNCQHVAVNFNSFFAFLVWGFFAVTCPQNHTKSSIHLVSISFK